MTSRRRQHNTRSRLGLARAGVLDVQHRIVVLLEVHFAREEAQHCLVWHKLVAADLVARHISSHVEDLLEGVMHGV